MLHEPHDLELYYEHNGVLDDLRNVQRIVKYAKDFDIVHLHGGIFWKRLDVLDIKLVHRLPLVVHYHGSETRDGYGMHYRFLADHKFVSRPDLLRWHHDGEYIPNPVERMPYVFDVDRSPKILHMATNRRAKGTDLIEQVLSDLKNEGLDFEQKVLYRVRHEDAIEELKTSHILIDQVIDSGSIGIPSIIGMASLEAMAMGKATISTFDEGYRQYYPGCPVVVVEPNAEALKDKLRWLIGDLEKARQIGVSGREYVQRHHDPDVISKRTLDVYEKLL